jgi:DNA-binding transcriptional LysR family regulator
VNLNYIEVLSLGTFLALKKYIYFISTITWRYILNLNHLAIFQAIAEAGSIGGGAARLHISQPAASKQLKDFESTLGLALFDRLPRGVRLSAAGEQLLIYARRISATENAAEQALAELRNLHAGKLAIGASTTIGNYLLPALLAEYRHAWPGIEIVLEIANTELIQRKLLDNVLDLGLTEGFVESDELHAEVFAVDQIVVIAAPDHPLTKCSALTLQQLCHEPCVLREPGSGTRSVIEHMLTQRGLQHAAAMSLGSTEAIKRAVAAGAGISLVSRLAVSSELAAKTLVLLPVEDLQLERPLHKLSLRNKQASRAVQVFAELLTLHLSQRG